MKLLKDENDRIYSSSDQSSRRKLKAGRTEMEKLKSLRSEAEQLRINIATISKEQELKGARLLEVEGQIKERSDESKETKKRLAILDNELQELGRSMKEMQEKIGKSDANSQELYRKMQDLDSKLAKLGGDRAKYQLDTEKVSRDLIEQETRKVQLQTRITDIKAELLSYQNVQPIKDSTQEELDAKKTIAKSDIERLGAVNLKAPEVYLQKKKDVDECQL